jgi:hypothetical protein
LDCSRYGAALSLINALMGRDTMSDAFATFEVDGFTIEARTEYDDDATPPWEREDGHGAVSEWTTRDKRPGERVIASDRSHRRLYYDFAGAVETAKRDGWDSPPYDAGTRGERSVRAVEADFRYLQSWCNDDWHYVGVILSVSRNGVMLDKHAASLWGVEDSEPSYLQEVARELVDEAAQAGRDAMVKLVAA